MFLLVASLFVVVLLVLSRGGFGLDNGSIFGFLLSIIELVSTLEDLPITIGLILSFVGEFAGKREAVPLANEVAPSARRPLSSEFLRTEEGDD